MTKRLFCGELKITLDDYREAKADRKTMATEYEAANAKRKDMEQAIDGRVNIADAHLHAIRIIQAMVRDGEIEYQEELTTIQAEAMRELLEELGGQLNDLGDNEYEVILE